MNRCISSIIITISLLMYSCLTTVDLPSDEEVPEESIVIEAPPPIEEEGPSDPVEDTRIDIDIRELPSVIVSLETDVAGNPIDGRAVYEGLFSELSFAGFNLISADVQIEEFLPANADSLYEMIRSEYGADQIIVGTASILRVNEEQGFNIQVMGSLQVFNFIENRYIIEYEAETNAQGGDSARVVNQAFASLGQNFGKYIVDFL